MSNYLDSIKKFGIVIVDDLEEREFVKEKKTSIPYFFAKEHLILPIEEKRGVVTIATSNPFNSTALKEVEMLLKKDIEVVFVVKEKLEKAIERCYSKQKSIFSKSKKSEGEKKEKDSVEGYDLLESSDNPVVYMLNMVIVDAIQRNSSDIHFEPYDDGIIIRYRIDGVLKKISSPPIEFQNQLITRLKIMSKLDIAESRRPQDGRIKLKIGKREIDFRVSSIPTIYGERIVLRILDKENIVFGLEKLGMNENIFSIFKKLISMPEGIILVTGPTGSGKTTTLYSAISEINSEGKNIMTIEDPVEYKLENIAQINVNPKINLTFASGLRHILRQDPDSIMVGEIRDVETAEIAIQSALTGHLVLSTLHTNDAPSAITRLADMGIEPYLLASSIIGILAQRLVRKICVHCKTSYSPTKEERKKLKMEMDLLYKGNGCDHCFNTGFKGRHGIYELVVIGSNEKKQIMKSVDSENLKKVSALQNMENLRTSGLELIRKGITSFSEVLRVTQTME